MGMFDDLMGAIFGGDKTAPQGGVGQLLNQFGAADGQKASVMTALMAMVEEMGGVDGILQRFQQVGLGDLAASWLSTGSNAALSPSQLQQVFGAEAIGRVAEKAGMSAQQAGAAMSELLPDLVDRLSPQGALNINHVAMLQQGLSLLRGIQRR